MTGFLWALGIVWAIAIVDVLHDRRKARREHADRRNRQREWDAMVERCTTARERQLNFREAA